MLPLHRAGSSEVFAISRRDPFVSFKAQFVPPLIVNLTLGLLGSNIVLVHSDPRPEEG